MDYEKAYKEALERARQFSEHPLLEDSGNIVEYIFPELAESEDERMIKFIKKQLYNIKKTITENYELDAKLTKAIDWLEKQGEKSIIIDIDKMVLKYSQTRDGDFGFPVNCQIRAYRQGINDALHLSLNLEKQDEQKPFDYGNANIQQKDFAPKVEPKFKNGQWIVWQNKCYKVNYNGCGYELVDQNGLSTSLEYGTIDENAHLWDITKDAKDGDVLVASDGSIFLFKCTIYCACKHYAALTTDNVVKFNKGLEHYWENSRAVYPATKEQRDTLMKAMADAGYTFDFEKKELKKIEQKPVIVPKFKIGDTIRHKSGDDTSYTIIDIVNGNYICKNNHTWKISSQDYFELVEQKPVWSEEDEKVGKELMDFCIKCSQGHTIVNSQDDFTRWATWLKSFKDRVLQQPKQEWSGEDDYNLQCMIAKVTSDIQKGNVGRNYELIDWLKSIKERVQPKQEWSEKDEKTIKRIDSLLYAINESYFKDIHAWLKSLKEKIK